MRPNEMTQNYELDPDETALLGLKVEDNLWPFSRTGDLRQAIDQARGRLTSQFDQPHALPGPQFMMARLEYLRRFRTLGAMEAVIVTDEPTPFTEIENYLREVN